MNSISFVDVCGWYTPNQLNEVDSRLNDHLGINETYEQSMMGYSVNVICVIAGYLPIVGTAVGVAELILAKGLLCTAMNRNSNETDSFWEKLKNLENKDYHAVVFLRAIVTTLSLGCLLIPVDVVATVYRNCFESSCKGVEES